MPRPRTERPPRAGEIASRAVVVGVGPEQSLRGELSVPRDARGVILIPCTARATPNPPYHTVAATALNQTGFATLVLDVLTPAEKGSIRPPRSARTLADRLSAATRWLGTQPETTGLPVGYLATTGTASTACLLAADRMRGAVGAVVSIGMPDEIEIAHTDELAVPTLLISNGSIDDHESGETARRRLLGTLRVETIPGAHTLGRGDPGPHNRALRHAADWFGSCLREPRATQARQSEGSSDTEVTRSGAAA